MARLTNISKQIKMRLATEDMMKNSTVEQFRNFILENAEVEEDDDEVAQFIPYGEQKFVKGKTYMMTVKEMQGDEFIITEDGRIFFALSLIENIEVIDPEETVPFSPEQLAESIAIKIRLVKIMPEKYEGNKREYPIYSEWKGMEQAMKLMGIDFSYEFNDNLEITKVTVMGYTRTI